LASAGATNAEQLVGALHRINWLNRITHDLPPDSVVVMPETLLGTFDSVEESAVQALEQRLSEMNSRVLVGAELPLPSGEYQNTLLVLGARPGEARAAIQGIPVPVSMWKPWASDGAVGDLLARSSTISVQGVRVAASVCYEQLLSYSLLRLAADRPQVIAAVSNIWWGRDTNIPLIQSQSVNAFGRLFNVPVITARNT
jgi:apolipoprotein N-acyltransferase